MGQWSMQQNVLGRLQCNWFAQFGGKFPHRLNTQQSQYTYIHTYARIYAHMYILKRRSFE
jgi:hypothetical protein